MILRRKLSQESVQKSASTSTQIRPSRLQDLVEALRCGNQVLCAVKGGCVGTYGPSPDGNYLVRRNPYVPRNQEGGDEQQSQNSSFHRQQYLLEFA